MSRHAVAVAVRTAVPAGLAIAALLLIMSPAPVAGFILVCGALVASVIAPHRPALGSHLPTRLVATAAVLALAAQETDAGEASGTPWALLSTGALLLGVLLLEPLLYRLARAWYVARRLPAAPGWAAAAVSSGAAWLVNTLAIALVGLAALLAWPAWIMLAPALAAGALTAGLAVDGARRWRTGHAAELAELRRAVQDHQPRFVLYFSAPPGSEYQATMWLPQLARLGEPFLVVLAEEHNLPAISRATSAPVVVHHSFESLEATLASSVRAAFYVNNGMKNAHCVRFTHITHIQLYHGDSDKAVTASPLNAMYDKIFVAGQAAVERFAQYGVSIPREKFVVVGRPQVAELATVEVPIGKVDDPVVLYAPTWAGAYADSNYCSLPIAETILQGLLERGVSVILRAHPYAVRDRRTADALRRAEQLLAADHARTGRAHRWGAAAATPGLFECMNDAHAMICDVSAVASDFLYTGKPFAITDMGGAGQAFTDAFPLARAAYVLDRTAGNLAGVLDDLLTNDPLAETRRELRTHYLGEAAPDQYAETFLTEARRWL